MRLFARNEISYQSVYHASYPDSCHRGRDHIGSQLEVSFEQGRDGEHRPEA